MADNHSLTTQSLRFTENLNLDPRFLSAHHPAWGNTLSLLKGWADQKWPLCHDKAGDHFMERTMKFVDKRKYLVIFPPGGAALIFRRSSGFSTASFLGLHTEWCL